MQDYRQCRNYKKYCRLGPHGKFQGLRDVTWVQIIYINKFTNTKKEKINEDKFLIIVRTAALELMYVRTSECKTFLHCSIIQSMAVRLSLSVCPSEA